jgi:hypothetical protein
LESNSSYAPNTGVQRMSLRATADAESLGGLKRLRALIIIGILGAVVVVTSAALATEDVIAVWKEATFRAQTDDLGVVDIDTKTEIRQNVLYLSSVRLRLNAKDVPCPVAVYGDLEFPQLETFQLVQQYKWPTQIRFKFGRHSTAIAGDPAFFPQVRIDVDAKGCGGREFLVPKGDGTIVQKEKP